MSVCAIARRAVRMCAHIALCDHAESAVCVFVMRSAFIADPGVEAVARASTDNVEKTGAAGKEERETDGVGKGLEDTGFVF